VSCFLLPWSRDIVRWLLGDAYLASWSVLALMLLYPMHQSLGQVNAAVFMGCGRTKEHMVIAVAGQLLSLPMSFALLAPADYSGIGLQLGAYGLALKLVVVNIVMTNVQTWIMARFSGWKFDWSYQLGVVGTFLVLSYAAAKASQLVFAASPDASAVELIASACLFGFGTTAFILAWPGATGLERADVRALLGKFGAGTPLRRS
jgi:O-antigen/teichoic acid export membrane protein